MNVAMEDGLPRRFADVDTDVEAIRMESLLQDVMTLNAESSDLHMFFHFKVKEAGHMPFGNDESVALGDRKAVVKGYGQAIFGKYFTDGITSAEGTRWLISILTVLFKHM